jgi:hypothetical protein
MKTVKRLIDTGKKTFFGEPLWDAEFCSAPTITQLSSNDVTELRNAISNPELALNNALGDAATTTMGANQTITTLTYLRQQRILQKFYTVDNLADYLPIEVGTAPWVRQVSTFREYYTGTNFWASGTQSGGQTQERQNSGSSYEDLVTAKTFNWNDAFHFNTWEVNQALAANNWDLIGSRMTALKRKHDTGLTEGWMLGNPQNSNYPGLLNNPDVTVNTSLITALLSSLTAAQINTFVAQVVEVYRAQCNRTAWPTTFIMPEDDWNGTAAFISSSFPLAQSTFQEVLINAFVRITGNKNFKILPLAYAMPAYNNTNGSSINAHCYMLFNNSPETLLAQHNVPFHTTAPFTSDGIHYVGSALSQFTGVKVFRPLEVLEFKF